MRRTGILATALTFLVFAVASLPMLGPAAVAGGQQVPRSMAEIRLGFVPVVKKTAPAVVNIYTRKVIERRFSPFAGDPFCERLFGDLCGQLPPQRRIENSLGSGVIVDPSGIVVSNYHVVGEADQITVVLADRREFDAKVILADKEADLAVVKLRGARNLPTLELRDSDTLEVGELVLAIGNPFGVGQTVTSGIISGLARSAGKGSHRGYFIQTDAAINPGNSGGALVDMDGRLVGINSMILSRSGGSIGIGFAVPANLVARVIRAAKKGKKAIEHPWLGLEGQEVTGEIADALGLDRPRGVLVSTIHPKSPFARAGVKSGDVIVSLGGAPVNSLSELAFRADTIGTGRKAQLVYLHKSRQRRATVVLAPAPEDPPRDVTTLHEPRMLRGLTVMNVNPAVIEEFGLPLSTKGVMVAGVEGPALRTGLRPGDLILAVNGRDVTTVRGFRRAVVRGGPLELEVERQGLRGVVRLGG